jgi:hypothetical protein
MAAGQFPGRGTSREWSPRIAVGAILRVGDDPAESAQTGQFRGASAPQGRRATMRGAVPSRQAVKYHKAFMPREKTTNYSCESRLRGDPRRCASGTDPRVGFLVSGHGLFWQHEE